MNMSEILSILLLLLLAPILAANAFFVVEIAAGLARRRAAPTLLDVGEVAIVIPAHDEKAVIGETLRRLEAALGTGMRVLVVADNCTDDTAAIARSCGVEAIERHDPARRGKGFALAFARDHLLAAPPSAVVVFDADCHIDRLSLERLVALSAATGQATQAVYLFEPDAAAAPMVQISSFAFLIKNLVRQRGLQRLAGRVHLTGTGMCLPWPQFAAADLATASIVEDLRLGLELAECGVPPLLVDDSIVWSTHASASQTLGQRSRWEGGFLATMRATAPALLARGLRRGSLGTVLAGFDLLVPPLALLMMINAGVLAATVLFGLFGLTGWLPALVLVGLGLLEIVVLLLAWWREGRTTLSGRALLSIPGYALWKLPMYAGLVRKGAPATWNRTERASETNREAP
ncbi:MULTISPECIES: glycosyltransferase family 2 protein [Sphingomonas]|uniref:glycosyltransferase family 2 protein n=1 Tax=Sphingomonas TaxID=13687 RepID=UPI001F07D775|nr:MULTISPECIES: glycosyltransferase family 2 protein [Sphingomonas]